MQYYANILACIVAISGSTLRIRSVNMGFTQNENQPYYYALPFEVV